MADGSFASVQTPAQPHLEVVEKRFALPRIPGLSPALPVVIGYLPVSFAFGLVASQAKLSFLATFLMSFLVYAGCAQFVAVSLLVVGAGAWPVVLSTLIINSRHLLFSLSIAPRLAKWKSWKRLLFGLQMTDESFLVNSATFASGRGLPATIFGTNLLAHTAWMSGTVLGYCFATKVGDISAFGLDFALPAMFICLLMLQFVSRLVLFVSLSCAICLIAFKLLGFGAWSPILATLLAATVGTGISSCKTRS
jgi:4-azaleucine resistance transporter AzlC